MILCVRDYENAENVAMQIGCIGKSFGFVWVTKLRY